MSENFSFRQNAASGQQIALVHRHDTRKKIAADPPAHNTETNRCWWAKPKLFSPESGEYYRQSWQDSLTGATRIHFRYHRAHTQGGLRVRDCEHRQINFRFNGIGFTN